MTYHPEVKETPWNLEVEGNPAFAVIVGETIQCIRTALDYLVYGLVLHSQGRKPRNMTQFPLCSTARDFYRTRHQVAELPGDLRRRIRKLQPYQTKSQRSDLLNLLRRLSNADKHRLLIVMETQIGAAKINRRAVLTRQSIGVVVPQYLAETNFEQKRLSGDPNIAAVMYFALILGEGEGQDTFDVLKRLLWTATEIIDSFRPVFA